MLFLTFALSTSAWAELKVGDQAPEWTLKNQDGKAVTLADRKGKGWTVLYFYPKADSPGCTTQACAFRDAIKRIEKRGALLYGISADKQEDQKKFHEKHQLNFELLSDDNTKVISGYGIKIPLIGLVRRWTFIIDEKLVIQGIEKDVDPAFDAEWTAETLDELQKASTTPSTPEVKIEAPKKS